MSGTSLQKALEAEDMEKVYKLVQNGYNDPNWTAQGLLVQAAVYGHLELVKYLIEVKGADPNAGAKIAFSWASQCENNQAVVDYLKTKMKK